ncbi:urease accessory protein UreF [Dongia soli]|uniref:Urease accessory protein UreF n=1 Tax=Dongia soli TaxID=600628 RepID=A0ABU5ECY0_9PROT|nr:urease accessory UreF family protein [Dongia soli]MDY0883746.1 urease accessory UreF family protein [Dongia soli]
MISETHTLLAAFQHADSFFPGGATAFSWGLETLVSDGVIGDAAGVESYLRAQITHRWATSDLPMLQAALAAHDDQARLIELDHLLDAMSLAARLRTGSARCGAALLSVHMRLGSAAAERYRELITCGEAFGHLPIVQGLVWGEMGLPLPIASAVSANALCQSIVSAAIRLGILSHIDSQLIIGRMRPTIAVAIEGDVPAANQSHAYIPQSEIALMRHEIQDNRLFAN